MSRDLTPREMFFASIKTDPFQKVLDMEYRTADGSVYRPYSEDDKKEIRQYKTLGRSDADMVLWIKKECERVGLDSFIVLNEIEGNLRELVKKNTKNTDLTIRKWFDGELDKDFYYASRNDALLKEYLSKKILEYKEYEMDSKIYDSVKDWYCETYPTDDLGQEIPEDLTFEGIYQALIEKMDVYELLGAASDSVVRERVFEELAIRKDINYDVLYDMWLDTSDYKRNLEDDIEILLPNKSYKAVDIQWDIDLEPGENYEEAVESIGLPSEIPLPSDLETEEDISDYITYKTGYCHKGFGIEENEKQKNDFELEK